MAYGLITMGAKCLPPGAPETPRGRGLLPTRRRGERTSSRLAGHLEERSESLDLEVSTTALVGPKEGLEPTASAVTVYSQFHLETLKDKLFVL